MRKKPVRKTLVFLTVIAIVMSLAAPALAANANGYATREQAISEIVQCVGRRELVDSEYVLALFDDGDQVSEQYRLDVSRAVIAGITAGSNHKLYPTRKVTRLEVMLMLSRAVGDVEAVRDPITFKDTPASAREDMDKLTAAGLVNGGADGRLRPNDYITLSELSALTGRADEVLSTVSVGESFYGYVNNKSFRNADLTTSTVVDAVHGAVIQQTDSWSPWLDITGEINADEMEILTALMDGSLPYEQGTPEQRVHDLLLCLADGAAMDGEDQALIRSWRDGIWNAETPEELLEVCAGIFAETGVHPLLNIAADVDSEHGGIALSVSLKDPGQGGVISFRSDCGELLSAPYQKLLANYAQAAGLKLSARDLEQVLKVEALLAGQTNYYPSIVQYMALRQLMGLSDGETIEAALASLRAAHPELDETGEYKVDPTRMVTPAEADSAAKGLGLSEMLEQAGFHDLSYVKFPYYSDMVNASKVFTRDNLTGLKFCALLSLANELGAVLSGEEATAAGAIQSFIMTAMMSLPGDTIEDDSSYDGEDYGEIGEQLSDLDSGDILSAANLSQVNALLPMDIGTLYATYTHSDEDYAVVEQIFQDIGDAYLARFEANEWMSDSTKAAAAEKIHNMICIVGYPENYDYPDILSPEEGGTLFSNTLAAKKDDLNTLVRMCGEEGFSRTLMLMSPDTLNACYTAVLNSVNIFAGILNSPIYDPDASYAANLGAIGAVVAHEIGHAFDVNGSQYDEIGRERNWWTEEDEEYYQGLVDRFIDYYANFEVVTGVVQDSTITIGENMADFAGLTVVMDILDGDPEAQREALISFASVWAKMGSIDYLTEKLDDVHSSNNVRVDATVASLDIFYELYDISEDDPMYVAPEDRLILW